MRFGLWIGLTGLAISTLLSLLAAPALAQQAAPTVEPPAQVKTFVDLLSDPEVRDWLQTQIATNPAPPPAEAAGPATLETSEIEELGAAAVERWRRHRETLVAGLPKVPGELAAALGRLAAEVGRLGLVALAPLIALFVGAGLMAEWLFLRGTRTLRKQVLVASEATVGSRVRKVVLRLLLALMSVVIFALASLGAFLIFDWPPLFRNVAGRFLLAFIVLRLGLVVARVLLAPTLPQLRVMPIDTDEARFWLNRWVALLTVFVVGWALATSFRELGAAPPTAPILAYLLGLGLVAITIETILNRRREAVEEAAADGDLSDMPSSVPTIIGITWTVGLYLLWLQGAMRLFWLVLIAGLLPAAIRVTQRAVNNLLRPVGADAVSAPEPHSVLAAVVERGARALIIVETAFILAWAWDIDLGALARGETGFGRLAGAAIGIVLIVMLADFGWHVAKTAIDARLHDAVTDDHVDEEEARRRSRVRTLLPILRNVLFVLVIVTTILMALAALGVQIGPLIAGAGVVGVAVGFGAQTVVKDIISGMFYLLDDAFRVGEYIVSGSYKGTVESFSIRSIKLRHQRGPLYTVPFGSLGAIQNMSRDWVIDKLMINVPYDTDLDRMKKVVKQVGKELAADPELAPDIIEPLKMQGVNQMGDFAMQVSLKMMCRPGHQFIVRRRAYAMLKKAFAANDIQIAVPTVSIAGGDEAQGAAARQAMELVHKPAAE
jgi:small-conductance mechanosensitive channel